jgi:hypothetical protein
MMSLGIKPEDLRNVKPEDLRNVVPDKLGTSVLGRR